MEKQVLLEVVTELLPADAGADGWAEPVIVVRIYNSRLTPSRREHVIGMIEHAMGFDEPEFTLRDVEEPSLADGLDDEEVDGE